MTLEGAVKMVKVVSANFPSIQIDSDKARDIASLWFEVFCDRTDEEVHAAINRCLRTEKDRPTVAVIMANLWSMTEQL